MRPGSTASKDTETRYEEELLHSELERHQMFVMPSLSVVLL